MGRAFGHRAARTTRSYFVSAILLVHSAATWHMFNDISSYLVPPQLSNSAPTDDNTHGVDDPGISSNDAGDESGVPTDGTALGGKENASVENHFAPINTNATPSPGDAMPRNGALVIVLSGAANVERRDIIRATWWRDLDENGWDGVFLVGGAAGGDGVPSSISEESRTHGDVWIGAEPEEYRSPAIFRRIMGALRESSFRNYRWVLKADDDAFVHVKHWRDWTSAREAKRVYAGLVQRDEPPVKDSTNRSYEDKGAWPAEHYLPFASSFGYILSGDVVRCFVTQANVGSFRVLKNEDIMMGVMAYLCQVQPADVAGLSLLSSEEELSSTAIVGEVHDSKIMRCFWEAVHGGMPCVTRRLVNCGQHFATDCGSCPQGNGAAWCNGDCTWLQRGEEQECVAMVDVHTPSERDRAVAASASAFSGPCPFVPPSTVSQHNGGWLYDLEVINKHHVPFDRGFGDALARYIEHGSVIDVGAGVGQLGIFLKKNGYDRIKWYGYDGGNNIQDMQGLQAPLNGDKLYVIPALCWMDASKPVDMEPEDWVVSIEVGEHIDGAFEGTFIDNLVKLSKKGVVLSWAVEGQGGWNHINERSNDHIIRQMASRGMRYDEDQSRKFRESVSELEWLKKTLMVFHHDDKGMQSQLDVEELVNCGQHFAEDCGSCPQGNGAAWCNGECEWLWHLEKCVAVADVADYTLTEVEDYSSLVRGPTAFSLLPAGACRPHVVLSTFKCPECDDLRRTIEDNTKHSFSSMEPDRLAFFAPPETSLKLNKYGVPVLGSIFDLAIKSCPDALTFTYVNGDILPKSDFLETVEAVSNILSEKDFLIVGRRVNANWTREAASVAAEGFDFDSHFRRGEMFTSDAQDYFVFTKNAMAWNDIPPFVVGRPSFDNWIVNHIYNKEDVVLVDATSTASLIHQTDNYGEYSHGGGMVKSQEDRYFNERMAKGDWQHGLTDHARFETQWRDGKVILVDRKRCEEDSEGTKKVLDLVRVAPLWEPSAPKILCYVLTTSAYHKTRIKAVLETWGSKCDRFFVASDRTDESIGAVEIPNTRHDYDGLWQKHRETMRYFAAHNIDKDYDWFLKVDDDTYVIVENLRAYLGLPQIEAQRKKRPLHLGHRFSLPHSSADNRFIPSHLKNHFDFVSPGGKWTYCSGGAGYAMNSIFIRNIVENLDTDLCLNDTATVPEDMGISFCQLLYSNTIPLDTRDGMGRERFQPLQPSVIYNHNLEDASHWLNQYHEAPLDRLKTSDDAISSETISFHLHKNHPEQMGRVHDYLYYCRQDPTSSSSNENQSSELLTRAKGIHAKYGVVNLMFLNQGYIDMTKSFICNLIQVADTVLWRTVFVATDQEAYKGLLAFDTDLNVVFEPFHAPSNVAYGQVVYYEYMLFRSKIVLSMLEVEATVWITEADAMWLRDPTEEVVNTTGDIVVASDVGTIGTLPEGGFMLLRPSASTISVWKLLIIEQERILRPLKGTEGGNNANDIGDSASDQLLLERVIQQTPTLEVGWLDPQKFVPGIWYSDDEFRQSHAKPWVLQNNWIVGNKGKVERAKKWKHWFLGKAGDGCLPFNQTSLTS